MRATGTAWRFVAFLKHDDPARVTPEAVIQFKDHRLASTHPRTKKPISAKTVKDSDLAGLKTILAGPPPTGVWGLTQRPASPSRLGSGRGSGPKGFTDAEAKALLKAALEHKGGSEQPGTAAAKRWVPWLCAYTGARVGELRSYGSRTSAVRASTGSSRSRPRPAR
jgi:integrase